MNKARQKPTGRSVVLVSSWNSFDGFTGLSNVWMAEKIKEASCKTIELGELKCNKM